MLAINVLSILVQLVAIASQSASAVYAGAAALLGCCAGPKKEPVYSMPVSALVSNDGYAELDGVKPTFGRRGTLTDPPPAGRVSGSAAADAPLLPPSPPPGIAPERPARHHALVKSGHISISIKRLISLDAIAGA